MAEHRKAKAKQWLDETFPETPRCGGRGTSDPRVRGDERGSERRRFHFGALRVPAGRAPPDPVLDDVDEDDTPAPPSARPEARRRREKRERRRGGDGVTFAPGTSGDASGEEDDRPRGRKDDEDDERRGGARGRTFLEWVVFIIGIALHIAVDVAIMFTPSIKSRQKRFGVADHARRRRAADASKPVEARRGASAAARRTTSFVPRGGARPARVNARWTARTCLPSCGDTSAPRAGNKSSARSTKSRCVWRRRSGGSRGGGTRRGGGEAQEGQGTRHGTRPAGGAVAPRRRVACRVVYRESGSTRRELGIRNASGVCITKKNIARSR